MANSIKQSRCENDGMVLLPVPEIGNQDTHKILFGGLKILPRFLLVVQNLPKSIFLFVLFRDEVLYQHWLLLAVLLLDEAFQVDFKG